MVQILDNQEMSERDFVYWLQGYTEVNGKLPDKEQWNKIIDKLKLINKSNFIDTKDDYKNRFNPFPTGFAGQSMNKRFTSMPTSEDDIIFIC